ncbi:MAG: hypothetical protein JRG73_16925 [Deltaproteobacteria bacterium]|nr:hypothetical protein [Deltaproteobacteria bacterium]MBW2308609.1 hypothetical protein [Deltaproteobacteria bacterium]
MMRKTAVTAFVLIVWFSLPVLGKSDIEIDTLVLDQTRTRSGQEFYREFVSLWETPKGISGFNIRIKERPDARWGSMIFIYVDDRMVFRCIVGRRHEEIMEMVERSIRTVIMHLYRRSFEKGKLKEEDLLGDGM